jgi:hypothetical protein
LPDAGASGRWECTECIDDSDCAPGVKCFVDQFECGGPVAGDAGHDVGVDVGDAGTDGGEDSG